MATFLLVHGAMHGGWCWRRLVPYLRAQGHAVWTPTLTGMGERRHLLTPAVDLTTHVRDILGVLTFEELTDVILVGHSYAGMVITAVAAEAAERLAHLVYLDAFTPHDGQSALDLEPAASAALLVDLAWMQGDGWRLPPQEAFLDRWGLQTEADRRWVWSKLTDCPLQCFRQPLILGQRAPCAVPRTYIECLQPRNEGLRPSAEHARRADWRYRTLATGHDAMVTAAGDLAGLLLELASSGP